MCNLGYIVNYVTMLWDYLIHTPPRILAPFRSELGKYVHIPIT